MWFSDTLFKIYTVSPVNKKLLITVCGAPSSLTNPATLWFLLPHGITIVPKITTGSLHCFEVWVKIWFFFKFIKVAGIWTYLSSRDQLILSMWYVDGGYPLQCYKLVVMDKHFSSSPPCFFVLYFFPPFCSMAFFNIYYSKTFTLPSLTFVCFAVKTTWWESSIWTWGYFEQERPIRVEISERGCCTYIWFFKQF